MLKDRKYYLLAIVATVVIYIPTLYVLNGTVLLFGCMGSGGSGCMQENLLGVWLTMWELAFDRDPGWLLCIAGPIVAGFIGSAILYFIIDSLRHDV